LAQRRGAVIEADPDEAGIRLRTDLSEPMGAQIETWESLGPRHADELPVQAVLPPVIRTGQCGDVTAAAQNPGAAVPAGVAEGTRHTVGTANQNQGLIQLVE